LKITGIVIGSLLVLVLIVVAIAWILLSRPSKIAAGVTSVPSNSQAAQSLDTKWNNFNSTIATILGWDTGHRDADSGRSKLKSKRPNEHGQLTGRTDVSNVNVNLKDGQILLSADMKIFDFLRERRDDGRSADS